MMRYTWTPYRPADASLVDTWLDDEAVRATGLDDGWQPFYAYWMAESRAGEGKDRCFLISYESMPFAVMYVAASGSEIVISEYVVAPAARGRGLGTAVLRELLDNAAGLLGTEVAVAKAAIYPGNGASIRAFEKAGFVLESRIQDDAGESLHFVYPLGAAV